MRNLFLMLGSIILVSGCGDGGIGGFPQVYPEAPEGKKFSDVLSAAEAVVKEHYPMSSTSIRSQHVFALGKVGSLHGIAGAGQHVDNALKRAEFLELTQLLEEILERELPLFHPLLELAGGFLVDGLGRLFNEADHIAHAEDA